VPVATDLLGTAANAVHSIHGAGDFLGVGYDVTVATFRVVREDCAVP
jgi:hypothetical protein